MLERVRYLRDLGRRWGRSIDLLHPPDMVTSTLLSGTNPLLRPSSTSPLLRPQSTSPLLRPQSTSPPLQPRLLHGDGPTLDPGGNEVDSSDDEEDFELEPAPVLADPAVLAAADLVHDHHTSDGESDAGATSSSDEDT
jgi:hypothetical protein